MMDPSIAMRRPEFEVECACTRCERRFGIYVLEPQDDRSIVPIDPAGRPAFPGFGAPFRKSWYWEPKYGATRRRKGPRTGTRLTSEAFEGRYYLRVVCKCGRNEKLGKTQLGKLMFDDEGQLRLRDGVLYL